MNNTFTLHVLPAQGRGYYSTPHDSAQGVPGFVFVGFWIVILLFSIRTAWEFREKIFVKNANQDKKRLPAKTPTPVQS